MPKERFAGLKVVAVVRALAFAIWLYILAFVFVPCISVCLPFVLRRDPEKRGVISTMVRAWSRLVVFPFFKVKMTGLEKLPPPGAACVYVANHASFMDILSAFHIPRPFKFISKASIFKIPLIGYTMKAADHISLEREDRRSQVEVFRRSIKNLQDGASLFIFPEGTRSKDGVIMDFKAKGAFGMARRAKVPIVPISILGTGKVMPGGKEYFMYPSWSGVQMQVHDAISAKDIEDLPDDELVARAKAVIESGLPEACRSKSTGAPAAASAA